jgi:hypothetical protein
VQLQIRVSDFSFDDVNVVGVRGTVTSLRVSADLAAQTAAMELDVKHPQYQGVSADSFHAEARLADGVARLENTKLAQAGSRYDLDGEYCVGDLEALLQGLQGQGTAAQTAEGGAEAVPAASAVGELAAESGEDEASVSEEEAQRGQVALHAAQLPVDPLVLAAYAEALDAEQAEPLRGEWNVQLAEKRRWWSLRRGRTGPPQLPKVPMRVHLQHGGDDTTQLGERAAEASVEQQADEPVTDEATPGAHRSSKAPDTAAADEEESTSTGHVPALLKRPSRLSEGAVRAARDADLAVQQASEAHPSKEQESEAQQGAPETGLVAPSASEQTWWLRLRTDAQLQDLMPALRLSQKSASIPAPASDAERGHRSEGPAQRASTGTADLSASIDSSLDEPVDFGSQELAMGYAAGAVAAADGFADFERSVQDCAWFVGEPAGPSPAASGGAPGHPERLPALSTLTGRLQGEVTASGGADGAARIQMDVSGTGWSWGPIEVQDLALVGQIDGDTGLQLEKCEVHVRSAHLHLQVLVGLTHGPCSACASTAPTAAYDDAAHTQAFPAHDVPAGCWCRPKEQRCRSVAACLARTKTLFSRSTPFPWTCSARSSRQLCRSCKPTGRRRALPRQSRSPSPRCSASSSALPRCSRFLTARSGRQAALRRRQRSALHPSEACCPSTATCQGLWPRLRASCACTSTTRRWARCGWQMRRRGHASATMASRGYRRR